MKVVILAGGLGTRLREETEFKPKPMVEIGEKPILWHIMKHYEQFGLREFVICLGYKGNVIRDYFVNYRLRNTDLTVTLGSPRVQMHNAHNEEQWEVTLAETGDKTLTGGRIQRIAKYIDGPTFLATYGDGVANVDIDALLDCHRRAGKLATVTAVHPSSRYGELSVDNGIVQNFQEKPQVQSSWINGGFFVFERDVFQYITGDGDSLELGLLSRLAAMRQLAVFQHDGFWQCMDTYREMEILNKMWQSGNAPWRTWRTVAAMPHTEPRFPAVSTRSVERTATMSNGHSRCLACSAPMPPAFLDLGAMPLANSYVPPQRSDSPEPVFPLAVAHCTACQLVQLTRTVTPEELFSEYLYFSSFSESYVAHAAEMAASLTRRFQLNSKSRVVEIASNDGYLLQHFHSRRIPVLGIEPASNIAAVAEQKGIPTWNRFFGPDVVNDLRERFGAADVIIGNNVLAHVPAVVEFLSAVRGCLAPTGHAVFEFPYLADLLERREFDTIYHEHVFYYSLTALRNTAARAGLRVIDVERQAVHGGSLRVFLDAGETGAVSKAVDAMLAEEERAGLTTAARYDRFSSEVRGLKESLAGMLRNLKAGGHRIAAYGAPAKGNTLLNFCGIDRRTIEFTVDRSPHKQGLLLPGSRIPIFPSEVLLSEMPDYTVILPWNLAGEITQQQARYQERGGRFIIPVPQPTVVDSAPAGRARTAGSA